MEQPRRLSRSHMAGFATPASTPHCGTSVPAIQHMGSLPVPISLEAWCQHCCCFFGWAPSGTGDMSLQKATPALSLLGIPGKTPADRRALQNSYAFVEDPNQMPHFKQMEMNMEKKRGPNECYFLG